MRQKGKGGLTVRKLSRPFLGTGVEDAAGRAKNAGTAERTGPLPRNEAFTAGNAGGTEAERSAAFGGAAGGSAKRALEQR